MRTAIVLLSVIAMGLALGFVPNTASAQATTLVIPLKDVTMVFPATLPCTFVNGTVTNTVNGVLLLVIDSKGSGHAQFTGTGAVSFVPDPEFAGTPSYTGKSTVWSGINALVNSSGVINAQFTLSAKLAGSDGSTLKFHLTFALTITPDGTITAFVARMVCN